MEKSASVLRNLPRNCSDHGEIWTRVFLHCHRGILSPGLLGRSESGSLPQEATCRARCTLGWASSFPCLLTSNPTMCTMCTQCLSQPLLLGICKQRHCLKRPPALALPRGAGHWWGWLPSLLPSPGSPEAISMCLAVQNLSREWHLSTEVYSWAYAWPRVSHKRKMETSLLAAGLWVP